MPKRSPNSKFGKVDFNVYEPFEFNKEVSMKKAQSKENNIYHKTEWNTDKLLIHLTEERELHQTISEVYVLCKKIKEEEDAMWEEILDIIVNPRFNDRSPSPDCDDFLIPKRIRLCA
jgi:hypothetical protein